MFSIISSATEGVAHAIDHWRPCVTGQCTLIKNPLAVTVCFGLYSFRPQLPFVLFFFLRYNCTARAKVPRWPIRRRKSQKCRRWASLETSPPSWPTQEISKVCTYPRTRVLKNKLFDFIPIRWRVRVPSFRTTSIAECFFFFTPVFLDEFSWKTIVPHVYLTLF